MKKPKKITSGSFLVPDRIAASELDAVRRINAIKPGRLRKTKQRQQALDERTRPYRTPVTAATMLACVGTRKRTELK
jgi:hypothetical protein